MGLSPQQLEGPVDKQQEQEEGRTGAVSKAGGDWSVSESLHASGDRESEWLSNTIMVVVVESR